MQHDVLETVLFRAINEAADQAMSEAAWAAQAGVEQQPGYVDRHFARRADGVWIDVVRWSSQAAADLAEQALPKLPEVARYFALIDPQSIQMQYAPAPAPRALWSEKTPVRDACLTLVLDELAPVRAFYEQHFNARAVFDHPAYVLLQLGGPQAPQLALMVPEPGRVKPRFGGAGVILNLRVDQVDALYSRLSRAALPMGLPLEDHPWGDRGFSTFDPSGLELYCYTPRATEAPFLDALRRPWVLD